MKGRNIVIAILIALMLTTVASSAHAGEDSGTETIDFFEPFTVEMEIPDEGSMKVSWDIKVTEGVPVNVVLLDEDNIDKFTQGLRYEPYDGHQYNYTNSSKRKVTVSEGGTYYLAVETTHSSMETSTIEYTVKWDEEASGFWAPWCWPAIIIALVLIFGVGILVWLRGRGGGTAVGPRTDVAPGPGTGDIAQLSPQPEPPDIPGDGGAEPPAPGTGVVHAPGEGVAELGPQPEPPDMPSDTMRPTGEGVTQLSPQPEPPDMPTAREVLPEPVVQTLEIPPTTPVTGSATPLSPPAEPLPGSVSSLGPQPEPPDMPTALDGSVDGGTGSEPPDVPTDDSGYTGSGERPAPGTGTVPADPPGPSPSLNAPPTPVEPSMEGVAQLSPQPEPPDMPAAMDGSADVGTGPEPPDIPPGESPGTGNRVVPLDPPDPSLPLNAHPTPAEPSMEGVAQLSPQPEPPDMPYALDASVDGGTGSEPPDVPTDDSGYTGSGEPPAPGTGTVPSEPPEPSGDTLTEVEPTQEDDGFVSKKVNKPPRGNGPTGEPL